MATARYAAQVEEHFERPHNAGRFKPDPDVIQVDAGRVAQGAVFHLSARVGRGGVEAARFEAYGCPHCIAAASWLTDRLPGMTADDLDRWSWREAAQALEVPAEKHGRLLLLEDGVRRLAEVLRARG